IAKSAEIGRCLGDAPRVREGSRAAGVGGEMVRGEQVAVSVKDVHHSTERRRETTEGNEELAIFILDLKGGVAGVLSSNVRIGEGAAGLEVGVEHIDPIIAVVGAVAAVGGIKHIDSMPVLAEGQTGVTGRKRALRGIVHHQDSMSWIDLGIPAANGSIQRVK